MNAVKFVLPLDSDYFTTVRLTTGGLCSLAGLDLDRSEDCKVCVTESLLLLTHAGYLRARIEFRVKDGLKVLVAGEGRRAAFAPVPEDEISAALLGALAEQVEVEKDGDAARTVAFAFGA